MSDWYLYICEKKDRLYVGITTDLKKRMEQHGNPKLLYQEGPLEKGTAAFREKQIKGWRREKKLVLIAGGPGKPR
ncbi:MAG: GIY-YIG nuclease family protein [bacterium]|nr:GIY-YIG nuclease family protein [bacterium]